MEKNKIYNNQFDNQINSKVHIDILLSNGIQGKNLIFFYYTDKYFYIQISDVRFFKFSMRRAKNSLQINGEQNVKETFYKNIKNIYVEKKNENIFYLNIFLPIGTNGIYNYNIKIKLKEVNDFINFLNTDSKDAIIKKQREKITCLLDKISEYENKYKEPATDEEIFILYK